MRPDFGGVSRTGGRVRLRTHILRVYRLPCLLQGQAASKRRAPDHTLRMWRRRETRRSSTADLFRPQADFRADHWLQIDCTMNIFWTSPTTGLFPASLEHHRALKRIYRLSRIPPHIA